MNVYKIGTEVTIKSNVSAIILQICIADKNKVSYEVSWWDSLQRKTAFLQSFEIQPNTKSVSTNIGFKK